MLWGAVTNCEAPVLPVYLEGLWARPGDMEGSILKLEVRGFEQDLILLVG